MVDVQTPLVGPGGPGGPAGPGGPGGPGGQDAPPTPADPPPARHGARLWGAVFESGLTLIMLGVVVLLFAAYQLWGTGVAEAQSQHQLARDFNRALSGLSTTTAPPKTPPTTKAPDSSTVPAPTTTVPGGVTLPPTGAAIPEGQAVGWIDIPKIGVHQIFVQGVDDTDLQKGPGHYPGTPYPGEPGNAAIAGHRTTFGAPFWSLNELNRGDQIITTTRAGRFVYIVKLVEVIRPNQTEVLNATHDNRLTLTTCHPRFLSYQRLIVVAALQPDTATAAPATQIVPSQSTTSRGSGEDVVVTTPPAKGAPATGARIIASPALNGSGDAWPPTILWGLLFAALWALSRIGFKKWRPRWAFLAAGIPLCLVVLWPFFENVSRLLPSNL